MRVEMLWRSKKFYRVDKYSRIYSFFHTKMISRACEQICKTENDNSPSKLKLKIGVLHMLWRRCTVETRDKWYSWNIVEIIVWSFRGTVEYSGMAQLKPKSRRHRLHSWSAAFMRLQWCDVFIISTVKYYDNDDHRNYFWSANLQSPGNPLQVRRRVIILKSTCVWISCLGMCSVQKIEKTIRPIFFLVAAHAHTYNTRIIFRTPLSNVISVPRHTNDFQPRRQWSTGYGMAFQ